MRREGKTSYPIGGNEFYWCISIVMVAVVVVIGKVVRNEVGS